MYFPFLTIFLIFIIFVRIKLKASDREDSRNKDHYWQREHLANNVRKQDISALPCIIVPINEFSFPEIQDNKLNSMIKNLSAISEQKIVNLSEFSNTDLKLKYGVANLPILSEYDENFTELLRILNDLGNYLYQLNYLQEALEILEFGISCGTDIRSHYVLLADIYRQTGQSEKISNLIDSANKLNTLLKGSILAYLKNSTMI